MTKSNIIIFILIILISICNANKVKIIHSTDIHGWVFGHPHEQELNADFGDFISLSEHLVNNSENDGEDLMFFDSGDLIEGTGLSDATPIHGYCLMIEIVGFFLLLMVVVGTF
jgi:2',3'-cyclic-nucleotide 2'-phosphodiesterase (5'-nucleotidase family)